MDPATLIKMGIHEIAQCQGAGGNPRYEHGRFLAWWAEKRPDGRKAVRSRPMGATVKGEPATREISPSARNARGERQGAMKKEGKT